MYIQFDKIKSLRQIFKITNGKQSLSGFKSESEANNFYKKYIAVIKKK